MELAHLFNTSAALVVGGGTLLATVLRCGIGDCRTTLVALGRLARPTFHADKVRADLAGQVAQIRQDGVLRARFRHVGDAAFDEATDALIRSRSIEALIERHEQHRQRRRTAATAAARTLFQAADLGPVFGLAGTLVSLSQLPAEGVARAALSGAISLAVLTTLYGVLIANIVFAPLARAVERQAEAEEAARQEVIDWLSWQLAPALPTQVAATRAPARTRNEPAASTASAAAGLAAAPADAPVPSETGIVDEAA